MKKTGILILCVVSFWACATFSRDYKLGTEAAMNKNWDEAIRFYEKALRNDPNNAVYRLALMRSRIAASFEHLFKARVLAAEEKKEEALAEYEKALSYDPSNRLIFEEAQQFKGEPVEEKEPEIEKIEPPIKLKTTSDKLVLRFPRETSLQAIFQALGKSAGINVIFDESFKDKQFRIDLVDTTFEGAANILCLATKSFFTILDEKTIMVFPDMPQNRMKFERNAVKTFYLSNILAQEVQQTLAQVIRSATMVPIITVNKKLNAITVKHTPEKLELAERILKMWDKPLGEVAVDLEIMEVSRTKIRDLGLDLSAYSLGLRYGGGGGGEENGEVQTPSAGWIRLDSNFSKQRNYQISLPESVLNFLETDADTKMIAQPRLRGVHGEKMQYLVGDEVPIPQTTFRPIAVGGTSQQPITSFTYKPVGIEVFVTPSIHQEGEVTLELELKIKALGGSGYGDLPIISTREVKNIIRLKDGETNLLAGLLKDEERKSINGILGIKNIPILGGLFSNTDQTIQQTDVILTVTPHIIRAIPFSEADRDPLWIPIEGMGTESGSLPLRMPTYLEERAARRALEEGPDGANQIMLSPPRTEGPQNRTYRISVNLRTDQEIQNMALTLSYDTQVLKIKSISQGHVVQTLGAGPTFSEHIDNSSGLCVVGFSGSQPDKGFKGSGSLLTLLFETVNPGSCIISISDYSATTVSGESVQFTTNESRVRIR